MDLWDLMNYEPIQWAAEFCAQVVFQPMSTKPLQSFFFKKKKLKGATKM